MDVEILDGSAYIAQRVSDAGDGPEAAPLARISDLYTRALWYVLRGGEGQGVQPVSWVPGDVGKSVGARPARRGPCFCLSGERASCHLREHLVVAQRRVVGGGWQAVGAADVGCHAVPVWGSRSWLPVSNSAVILWAECCGVCFDVGAVTLCPVTPFRSVPRVAVGVALVQAPAD